MTLRGAFICSALLHLLLAWMWFGHAIKAPNPEPNPLAVMLQLEAITAAQPAVKTGAKSIAHKQPQSAPALIPMMQTLKSNSVVPLKKTEPASAISSALKTGAVANTSPVPATVNVDNSSKAVGTAEVPAEGKITLAQYRAAHLQNPEPEMPYQSRIKGETGVVGLLVKVGTKGEVLAVKVETSSGFTRLDKAAVQTVSEKWRFVPAKMGDTPIESKVAFSITFKFAN